LTAFYFGLLVSEVSAILREDAIGLLGNEIMEKVQIDYKRGTLRLFEKEWALFSAAASAI